MYDFWLGNRCSQAYFLVKTTAKKNNNNNKRLLLITKNRYLKLVILVLFYVLKTQEYGVIKILKIRI